MYFYIQNGIFLYDPETRLDDPASRLINPLDTVFRRLELVVSGPLFYDG